MSSSSEKIGTEENLAPPLERADDRTRHGAGGAVHRTHTLGGDVAVREGEHVPPACLPFHLGRLSCRVEAFAAAEDGGTSVEVMTVRAFSCLGVRWYCALPWEMCPAPISVSIDTSSGVLCMFGVCPG